MAHGQSSLIDERRRARDRGVARVLWWVLVANLVVATGKIVMGVATGAVALLADGMHSVLDASSNVVGLVGIAAASRPPDREHPYGHSRFETLAATIIGLLIVGGLASILIGVVRSWMGTADPRPTPLAAAVVLITFVVNIVVSRVEAARGRSLKSAILVADSAHTRSDALASLVVLASFAAVALGFPWMDSVAALIVAVLIALTAWRVLSHNVGVLMDRARLDVAEVRRIALGVEGVLDVHRIRSRGSADHVHVDLCVHLDPDTPLWRAHETTHRVAQAIDEALPQVADVVIHTEPAGESAREGVMP